MEQPTPLQRALLSALLDDASMYPPAHAPMEAALGLHAAAAASPWAFGQGRFLCPAAALKRLARERRLLGLAGPLRVGAVVGSPADPEDEAPLGEVAHAVGQLADVDPAVTVDAVEYRPPDPAPTALAAAAGDLVTLADQLGLVQVAVEVVVRGVDPSAIAQRVAAVAAAREEHGDRVVAKVRCGAVDPAGVPTSAELAAFVAAAAGRVPFKATAGLHHALAIPHGSGRRHGYLNLLAATAAAADGAAREELPAILAVTDADPVAVEPDRLTVGAIVLTAGEATATRQDHFLSFGTCSFTEPVGDLVALSSNRSSA